MRIRRLVPLAAVALTFALLFAFAAPALGATSAKPAPTSVAASTPVNASAGGPVEVQIWPGQDGQTAVIAAVAIDANIKLPATVRIPVSPGTKVEWAGEILGGSAEADIEQPFTLVQGRGGQFAEFTLTKSHRGQIDAIGDPLAIKGSIASVTVQYVQSVDSTLTSIAVRIPRNTSEVKITPEPVGKPVTNVEGDSLYALNPTALKPGDKQTIAISYNTVPPKEPAAGSGLNPVLLALAAALVVAVVAMIVLVRRNSAAQTPDEYDAEDEEYDETEAPSAGGEESDSWDSEHDESDDAWTD